MHCLRLAVSNLLLCLALGSWFIDLHAQSTVDTDTNETTFLDPTSLDYMTVAASADSTGAVTFENIVTTPAMGPGPTHAETTTYHQMSTVLEESTTTSTENTMPLGIDIEVTTPASEEITTAQQQPTTMALETFTTATEPPSTAMNEPVTSPFLPSTSQDETTVGLITSEATSPTEHEDEITTTTAAMTIGLTETPSPPPFTSQPPAETTVITSHPVETTSSSDTITTAAATLTYTSQFSHIIPDPPHPTLDGDFRDSTSSNPNTTAPFLKSTSPTETNWLLIFIVCGVVICVLLGIILLLVQRRKKNASQKFGPGYMNGQSKRSKKKKGAEDDAWAGPVNLAAGDGEECDGGDQGGQLSDTGNGEDVVLSTFAALKEGDTCNGGVGGDGTKEARKWEEQEHLLYIDEDTEEDNERQSGDEKGGQGKDMKRLNGGETFCVTTAV